MSLADSQVSISLAALDELREQIKAAEDRARDLEKQINDAKLGPDPEFAKHAIEAFRAALPIVQFALGNLHPSTVRGWPDTALDRIAACLVTLPGTDDNDRALARELIDSAKLARGYEEFRRKRDALTVVLPASPADWGPQTEEAKAIHEARMEREGEKR